MKCMEPGVLENSSYYFTTLSPLAKSLYFYLLCTGHFYCDKTYHVKRKSYNSYLILYILKGECNISFRGHNYTAQERDTVFINCYEPHSYWSDTELEFLFIHFDGSMSPNFFDRIYGSNDAVFRLTDPAALLMEEMLRRLFDSFHKEQSLPESDISCLLQQILCLPLKPGTYENSDLSIGDQATQYINEHYREDLNLQSLASYYNLNSYYFSHVFKKETGCSPYEYLLQTRINQAKKLLKTTGLTVKSIGFAVGFHSESNFTYIFHKRAGMSPKEFRKLPF